MVGKPPLADVDPHVAQWVMFLLSLFFFGIAILGAVGEYLGWWELVGEVAMTVGTIAGLLLGVSSQITGATESQVDRVHEAVQDNGRKLNKLDKLDRLDDLDKLDRVQLELDRQTGVLEDIRDLL